MLEKEKLPYPNSGSIVIDAPRNRNQPKEAKNTIILDILRT